MRVAKIVVLRPSERRRLKKWAADRTDRVRSLRARIILVASAGLSNKAVAAELRIKPDTVGEWRSRFLRRRFGALTPAKRKTRRPLRAALIQKIVLLILEGRAPTGKPWTLRSLAKETGVSPGTVGRIWRKHASAGGGP
jgi:transposase